MCLNTIFDQPIFISFCSIELLKLQLWQYVLQIVLIVKSIWMDAFGKILNDVIVNIVILVNNLYVIIFAQLLYEVSAKHKQKSTINN